MHDSDISTVSFPGLGIEAFELNNTAFVLFGREVKWYGVIICFGMILAILYIYLRGRKNGFNFDSILDYAIFTIPIGVIGARLYYCVFYGIPFADIYKIWEGGLAIYGGIIFGLITILVVAHIKKQSAFSFLDLVAPGTMLAQACGRWGNFMNGEAYGAETTSFLRMGLNNFRTGYETIYVHPTFLYESLWNLLGFVIINIFYKKKKFEGEILFWYLGWYGLGRAFIELLRQDSLYIGSVRVSSLLGALCFLVAVPVCIFFRIRRKKMVASGVLMPEDKTYVTVLLGIRKKSSSAVSAAESKSSSEEVPCGINRDTETNNPEPENKE